MPPKKKARGRVRRFEIFFLSGFHVVSPKTVEVLNGAIVEYDELWTTLTLFASIIFVFSVISVASPIIKLVACGTCNRMRQRETAINVTTGSTSFALPQTQKIAGGKYTDSKEFRRLQDKILWI